MIDRQINKKKGEGTQLGVWNKNRMCECVAYTIIWREGMV